MKKRTLSILLIMAMLLGLMPMSVFAYAETDVAYPVEGGNIYFDMETGTITDSDEGVTVADIPPEINGVAVKCLGEKAFCCREGLLELTLPEGLETIGYMAIYNCGISSLMIPDTVSTIGEHAASSCYNLIELTLGSGLIDIQGMAFDGCSITELTIPDSVMTIGEGAFASCDSLASLTIGSGVKSIGTEAFRECRSLTTVTIPDNVEMIGKLAFAYCSKLTDITFGDGVTHLGDGILAYCGALPSVSIPFGVTSIGQNPFIYCDSLTGIWVDEANQNFSSGDRGELLSKDKTQFLACPTAMEGDYVTPDGVKTIAFKAFTGCHKLTSVTIGDSVETINESAFSGCASMTSVIIGNGVKVIGVGAFSGNTALQTVMVGNGLETIEDLAFSGCIALESVTLPASLKTVGWFAFISCKNLSDVYYGGTMAQWEQIDIDSDSKELLNATVHCIDGTIVPGEESTEPSEEPSENPEQPSENPEQPSENPEEPSESPEEPSENPEEPSESPEEPSEKPSEEPSEEPGENEEPVEPVENPFTDVDEDDYFCEPVLWAVGKGITNGMSENSFAPEAPCTRGQIVTFLWRACGSPEPTETNSPFADVLEEEYYYEAVLWAVEQGITTGLSKTSFGPNATCTRGQVATFLWRSQGKPEPESSKSPFDDVKRGDYYREAVLWAVENEVTQGMGGGKFAPNASCTRGQIVTFLFRAIA